MLDNAHYLTTALSIGMMPYAYSLNTPIHMHVVTRTQNVKTHECLRIKMFETFTRFYVLFFSLISILRRSCVLTYCVRFATCICIGELKKYAYGVIPMLIYTQSLSNVRYLAFIYCVFSKLQRHFELKSELLLLNQ